MPKNHLNRTEDHDQDNPGLSKIIERNIRTIIQLRLKASRERSSQASAARSWANVRGVRLTRCPSPDKVPAGGLLIPCEAENSRQKRDDHIRSHDAARSVPNLINQAPYSSRAVHINDLTSIPCCRTLTCLCVRTRDMPAEICFTPNRSETADYKIWRKEMRLFKAATLVCCMALISSVLAPGARADDWNKKTVITFSGPVEIPGVHLAGWGVLPAGTYVFKILNSQSDRHIVQIFSKDEMSIYATILAIPNYRLRATNKTVMTFRERPAGEPEALRAWFYPGRNWGEEFVYPKAKAIALAKAANTPVLFTPVEIPLEVAEPIKSADAPVVAELKRAPIMAIKPTGEEVQLADVVTPPPAQFEVATASRVPQKTLPSTASTLPLMGLFGLMALTGAFAVRAIAKGLQ